MSVKRT
jgi:hypothetical protein